MKQPRILLRRVAALLLAAAALPSTLSAQNAPVTQMPPVTQPPAPDSAIPPAAQPDPILTPPATPPVVQSTEPTAPPPSATAPTPITEAPAAPETRTTTRTTRTTTGSRVTTQPRSVTTARTASRSAPSAIAAAPAAAPTQPSVATAAPAPAPAATPAPLPVPEQPATEAGGLPTWTLLVGGALLLLMAFALFNMWRHRRRAHEVDEAYYEEPVRDDEPVGYDEPVREPHADPAFVASAPVAVGAAAMAADRREHRETLSTPMGDVVTREELVGEAEPAVAVAEDVSVAEPDPADVEALAAGSAAPEGRPWLEFLMRPVRAGTSDEAAVVEYELTVGNTGSAPARDVRISTFMFPAGTSDMEQSLIEPAADSAVEQGEIGAGEATRIEGQVALPRDAIEGRAVLPVLVADVRYRSPDGTEGRTRASFEVGIPTGHGLDPFPVDRISGLLESVEARLHGEPERV